MADPRVVQLARNLVRYSVALKPGEKILIETIGDELPLAKALVEEVYRAGGVPFLAITRPELQRVLLEGATDAQLAEMASFELARMKQMQAYIGLRGGDNVSELSGVPAEKMKLRDLRFRPVQEQRVNHTRWCVLRQPNASMAQLAGMSTDAFEDYYFRVCTLDYARMSTAMDALVALMERTERVRITGPGTDLAFSITDLPAIKCDGKLNIPDGEVFTAPVRTSVNGTVAFNAPAVFQGVTYEGIRLRFAEGRVVEATANLTERLNQVLDTDGGARFLGEFSLGVNPFIATPMKDALFDEKIRGSLHLALGNAYDECDNGNESAIHWDLVLIQRPEFGGGEVSFDGRVIRRDGLFVVPELEGLNPDRLG